MKYTLFLNQHKAKELGIKNINQGHIFDLYTTVSTWASPIIHDNKVYYWAARQRVCEELELLNLQPDTVYRHNKFLAEIGLIEYIKIDKKDCIRLTEKGKSYLSKTDQSTMSEINPKHYVGNKSEKVKNSEMNPTKLGNESESDSEMNPTYNKTNIIKHTNDIKSISNDIPKSELDIYKNNWNFFATQYGLNQIHSLTQSRVQKLKTRLKDNQNFFSIFEQGCILISKSDFLKGKNKNSWKVSFDWIIENDKNIFKILEGNYNQQESIVENYLAMREQGYTVKDLENMGLIK